MKKYKFNLAKYYTEAEINDSVIPVFEKFVNYFVDENNVASVNLKNDVEINVVKDEGLIIHMVVKNDIFTALPKTLTTARKFTDIFLAAMKSAILEEEKKSKLNDVIANLENKAESDLLNYISPSATPSVADSAKVDNLSADNIKVSVNGKEITDPDEKQKEIDEIEAVKEVSKQKIKEAFDSVMAEVSKMFPDFEKFFGKYLDE
jgi:hypothetical protein